HSERSYDMVVLVDFDTWEDLHLYAKHPAHQPALARSRELCAHIAAVDYERPSEEQMA
ncbi:MAG TPA: hypothetical protein EYP04_03380, partial [Anaerolineae bacterium]|nr:hypothetical protein [Anaerolineae bacterium]